MRHYESTMLGYWPKLFRNEFGYDFGYDFKWRKTVANAAIKLAADIQTRNTLKNKDLYLR